MAQSPEYSDLAWMSPRSWDNSNRTSVQLVVIHTTEGAARASAAEDGAAYDQRRDDGTSTHYFHDSTGTVQCVRTADQAHAARAQGNRRGIQHELCTRAGSANWADAYHTAMLKRAAKQAARDSRKWGIPVRHLSVAEVAAGAKGFCGHWDVTRAFPQDGGTHTDPGGNFPWTRFLDMVRTELNPALEDDMPTPEEFAAAVWAHPLRNPYSNTDQAAGNILRYAPSRQGHLDTQAKVDALSAQLAAFVSAEAADDATRAAAQQQMREAIDGLAATVVAQVIAALPEGSDQVSQEEVTAAVQSAFRSAFSA